MEANENYDNLRKLVEKKLQSLGYQNTYIKMSRGTANGDNYLAVIILVDIITNTAEGEPVKLHWIAKLAHQSKELRKHVNINLIYNREIYMYTKVFPIFECLQKRNGVSNLFDSYPPFVTSSLEDMYETIVMENLRVKGYTMKSRREPLDYLYTKYVFERYAKFHALSFALRDQDPEKFQEISENIQSAIFEESEEMKTSMAATITRAMKCLNEDDKEELKLLRHLKEHACDVLIHSCKGDLAGKHAVVIHGDTWMNNMLFKYDNPEEPHKPTHMVLLDYQLSRLGSPVADLSYFLYTCTDGNLREQYYEELLKDYYSAFSDFLQELGGDAQKLFPYEVFLDHWKRFSAYGILMAIPVLHLMLSDSDEVPVLTGDSFDVQSFQFESRNVNTYLARVKNVIRDIVKYGYDMNTTA